MANVRLIGSIDAMAQKIHTQIEKGKEIQASPKDAPDEIEAFQARFFSWSEYTSTLLDNSFDVKGAMTLSPQSEFSASDIDIFDIKMGAPKTAQYVSAAITSNLSKKLRVLESIRGRLEIWHEAAPPAPLQASGEAIFLVHGHDHESREYVRNFLLRCSSREVIVLDEAPGGGADILGKLLANAQKAAYAVVLLTGDDEGRVAESSDWQPRARQNVILELGLFIGLLGRDRVTALYEPGVEIPSDYLGVTYVELDKHRAWRIGLVGELRNAGIEASLDKTL
jgi:predicted nucleotide-binding protein